MRQDPVVDAAIITSERDLAPLKGGPTKHSTVRPRDTTRADHGRPTLQGSSQYADI